MKISRINIGILASFCFVLSFFCQNSAKAVSSTDVESQSRVSSQNLEPFAVEIRGPRNKKYDVNSTHNQIPQEKIIPTKKKKVEEKNELKPNFFLYEFPAGINFALNEGSEISTSNNNLYRIATKTKKGKVSIDQQQAAIYRKNLRCFKNGSLKNLTPNCTLFIPTEEQALSEDKKLATELLRSTSVSKSDYEFALKNCPNGVCNQKKVELKQNQKETEKFDNNSKLELVESDPLSSNVQYYHEEKSESERIKDATKTEVNATQSFVLVDDRGNSSNISKIAEEQNKPKVDNNDSKGVVEGTSLVFSGQTVQGLNNKGEILSEVAQNFSTKNEMDELKKTVSEQFNSQTAQFNTANQESKAEIDELKNEIKELKQLLLENASKSNIDINSVPNQDESSSVWIFITLILFVALGVVCAFFMIKNKKMKKVIAEDELEDIDDDADQFSSLMSMNSTLGNMGIKKTNEIDLNSDGDENKAKPKKEEFVLEDENVSSVDINLNSSETVSAEIGSESKSNISDDELVPAEDDLDESVFLNDEKLKEEQNKTDSSDLKFDLNSDSASLDDIDSVLNEVEKNKSEDDSELDSIFEPSENDNLSNKTDDIDALLSASKPEEKVTAEDDIDALLSANKPEEKVTAEDDIDALLSANKPEEKVTAEDDIDALLSANKPEEKVTAEDDIDALLSANKPKEKVTAEDDIDALLSANKPEEKVTAEDDIDALLSANQQQDEEELVSEDMQNEIKLAEAYIEMDDKQAAKELLENLLTYAKGSVKTKAEEMLRKVSK